MSRPTRYGVQPPPTGGALSRPIGGLGKLLPGEYQVTVLSVTRGPAGSWAVILQDHKDECHYEQLEDWPLDWPTGTELVATIGLGPGYVLYSGPQGFQARDAQTREPATGWLKSAADVYLAMRPATPAVPQLVEVTDGQRRIKPRLYAPPDTERPASPS